MCSRKPVFKILSKKHLTGAEQGRYATYPLFLYSQDIAVVYKDPASALYLHRFSLEKHEIRF
jgi:hypothetical protein